MENFDGWDLSGCKSSAIFDAVTILRGGAWREAGFAVEVGAHGGLELFGGRAGGLFEGDPKTIRTLVAANFGDGVHLGGGLGEEFFGMFEAGALEFAAGRAADVLKKCLVQSAA